jgi:hypothetical protein
VTALVEGDRDEPGRSRGASEVEVALLARAGAMEDHHAAAGLPLGSEQRVGEPATLAELRGRVGHGPVDAAVEQVE